MRKVSIGLGAMAAICALALPASALATETLTIAPKIVGTLGGPGKIVFGFNVTSTTPVTSALTGPFVEKTPAGIKLSATGFPICPYATLQADKAIGPGNQPAACPADSLIGTGTAITQIPASPPENENGTVYAYLTKINPPTIGFWSTGVTPIPSSPVFSGSLTPASGLYGQNLNTVTPVLPLNSATIQFSVTFGKTFKKGKKTYSLITLPKKCTGKLHWTASDTYLDGTSNTATATTPCPKK